MSDYTNNPLLFVSAEASRLALRLISFVDSDGCFEINDELNLLYYESFGEDVDVEALIELEASSIIVKKDSQIFLFDFKYIYPKPLGDSSKNKMLINHFSNYKNIKIFDKYNESIMARMPVALRNGRDSLNERNRFMQRIVRERKNNQIIGGVELKKCKDMLYDMIKDKSFRIKYKYKYDRIVKVMEDVIGAKLDGVKIM